MKKIENSKGFTLLLLGVPISKGYCSFNSFCIFYRVLMTNCVQSKYLFLLLDAESILDF